MIAYFIEHGLTEQDAKETFLHWTENGWKRGGFPIRDWRLCVQVWKAKGYFPSQRQRFGLLVQRPDPGRRSYPTTQTCICCKKPWILKNSVEGMAPGCKCRPWEWCNDCMKCKSCCECILGKEPF